MSIYNSTTTTIHSLDNSWHASMTYALGQSLHATTSHISQQFNTANVLSVRHMTSTTRTRPMSIILSDTHLPHAVYMPLMIYDLHQWSLLPTVTFPPRCRPSLSIAGTKLHCWQETFCARENNLLTLWCTLITATAVKQLLFNRIKHVDYFFNCTLITL